MKKIVFALVASIVSAYLCFGFTGCVSPSLHSSKEEGNNEKQITVSTADELANYIRYYYYNEGMQENTSENHYLLDKNYRLTQIYSQSSSNAAIPEYPENVVAETLPYSFTFINHDGDFYKRAINTNYATNLPDDYFLEEQSHEYYFEADTRTVYGIVTIDEQHFDSYPDFEERQRTYDDKSYWKFASMEDFNLQKLRSSGDVTWYLGAIAIIDLFKVDVTDTDAPIPHVEEERFEKLDIMQADDVVSFEIVYSDENLSSTAKGTLNVSKTDFKFVYSEIRYEADNVVIESTYTFELVSLDEEYTIDFDNDRHFEENSDYNLIL